MCKDTIFRLQNDRILKKLLFLSYNNKTSKNSCLRMKKKVVFLTGAGMSVESGFKTFRGNDGLWENYPVEQVASHEGWEADPTLVTNFYNMLRRKLWQAEPCDGHRLIARMEKRFRCNCINTKRRQSARKGWLFARYPFAW